MNMMSRISLIMLLLLIQYGSAQEADTLEKRGGGRPFTLVNEKRGGARFFKIQDPDDIEKRAGGRPFYINPEEEKRGGGRAFHIANYVEKRAGARPMLNYDPLANEDLLRSWQFLEKRAGGRAFPVVDDNFDKRRIYDALSRFP